jgi:hypothetical protein
MASTEDLLFPQRNENPSKELAELQDPSANETSEPTPVSRQPSKRTPYIQRLALFNGRKTDESMLKLVLRPFPLLFHPAILWGMVTQGTLIGWTVVIGVVLGVVVRRLSLTPRLPDC